MGRSLVLAGGQFASRVNIHALERSKRFRVSLYGFVYLGERSSAIKLPRLRPIHHSAFRMTPSSGRSRIYPSGATLPESKRPPIEIAQINSPMKATRPPTAVSGCCCPPIQKPKSTRTRLMPATTDTGMFQSIFTVRSLCSHRQLLHYRQRWRSGAGCRWTKERSTGLLGKAVLLRATLAARVTRVPYSDRRALLNDKRYNHAEFQVLLAACRVGNMAQGDICARRQIEMEVSRLATIDSL